MTFAKDLHGFVNRAAAFRLVNGLSSAAGISLPAEFALGRKRARTLFARSWFGTGEFLAFTGKPGWATLLQVQPLPSAQPWQQ